MIMDISIEIWILSFLAGLYTPLGAVCVLPMYPGYLAFLAARAESDKKISPLKLGLVVTAGVLLAMFTFGLIFVAFLQVSASVVIGILGPVVYFLLAIMSIGMIIGYDIGRFFPTITTPAGKTPYVTALLFGAFFGLVAMPCNPSSVILLFALSTTTVDFLSNFVNFVLFGIGMATPLLVLSALPMQKNRWVIDKLTSNHLLINRIAGVLMLCVSVYYLVFVFLAEYI